MEFVCLVSRLSGQIRNLIYKDGDWRPETALTAAAQAAKYQSKQQLSADLRRLVWKYLPKSL
jgi:hypothetical protein